MMVRQDLDAPGKELTVSVSYRSKTGGKAHVVVVGYAANSDTLALNSEVAVITGPVKAWTRKESKITLPDTVVKLSIAIRALEDGEFLFDDVVMSVAGAAAGAKASGPLANGGFESGLVGWQVDAPSGRVTFEPNGDARKSGAKGLHVVRDARCELPWDALVASLADLPKGAFTVRAQVRAEHATCGLEVRFVDEHGVLLKAVEVGRSDKSGWTAIEGKATPPRDAVGASVAILVTGKGTIDVDDVEIR
ncbi:MAG: hypothetical protein HYR85_15940 [Planctomycetes bacterium]|nr:hypothetical protein [Planctomycetota bacterium]